MIMWCKSSHTWLRFSGSGDIWVGGGIRTRWEGQQWTKAVVEIIVSRHGSCGAHQVLWHFWMGHVEATPLSQRTACWQGERHQHQTSDMCHWLSFIVIRCAMTLPMPFDLLLTVVPSLTLCFLKTLFPKVSALAIIEKWKDSSFEMPEFLHVAFQFTWAWMWTVVIKPTLNSVHCHQHHPITWSTADPNTNVTHGPAHRKHYFCVFPPVHQGKL